MKRVVTGRDASGKSVFVIEGPPPWGAAMNGVPEFRIDVVWSIDAVPTLPPQPGDPTGAMSRFFPAPGGTRFVVVTLPPASAIERATNAGVDLAEAEREFYGRLPGLGDSMEGAHAPGMHTTQTVDYGVVLAGEIHLELDDGKQVALRPGDCVVQNGTRHAWRNLGFETGVMAFVVVGAEKM